MPNVIGLSETAASNAIVAQGIAYEYTYYTSVGATAGNNNTVQSQSPGAGTYVGSCNYSYNASLTLYNYTAPTTTTTTTTTTVAPTTTTTAAPACVCNYSTGGQYQSYHFAPECCPGGSQRSGSLSGTTVNSCCPNVSKTITKWDCKSYDVTNPASNNYSTCYYVGECAANNNSDGSRTQCWLPA
jgi:hypothetical protein